MIYFKHLVLDCIQTKFSNERLIFRMILFFYSSNVFRTEKIIERPSKGHY
jgi:hypothetical protein